MTSTLPFLMAKAKSHLAKTPTIASIQAMISASSVSEAEGILSGTVYGDLISIARPSVNLIAFEGALRRQFAELLHTYNKAASIQASQMVQAFITRIEANNLQILFRAIIHDEAENDLLNYIIPVGKFGIKHYTRFIQSKNPTLAAELITIPELKRGVLQALNKSSNEDEIVYYVTTALEHASYQFTQKFTNYLRFDVDLLNIETVMRAIDLGIDPVFWIIPNYGIVAANIDVLSRMNTPRDAATYILNKVPFSSAIRTSLDAPDDRMISVLEREVDITLINRKRRNFSIFVNRKEALLDFFALKLAQIEDISRILLAKTNNMSEEKIKRALIYYQFN